jgi:hypothetical protein
MMQQDVISHYQYAMSHYFNLTLKEKYLQNSSIGTPYQKWQKEPVMPEENYCRGTMTGEEQESLALIILSGPNFLEGLMQPRLQTWK